MRVSREALRGVQSPRTGRAAGVPQVTGELSEGISMKTFAMVVGLIACLTLPTRADDKIDISGKYTVVSGKKNGSDIDEKAKKATYTVSADSFTIAGGEQKFVISYKIKPGTKPMEIDMAIAEG